jgi:competence protein ComEA
MAIPPSHHRSSASSGKPPYPVWQQPTMPQPAITTAQTAPDGQFPPLSNTPNAAGAINAFQLPSTQQSSIPAKKQRLTRLIAPALALLLALALYTIWHTTPSTVAINTSGPAMMPTISTTASGASNDSASLSPTNDSGTIAVYVTGAVKHPGVYTLPSSARVYQLLQAAGGALPGANLVALNLAAKLSDGQEVYVPMVGETLPPIGGNSTGTDNNGGSTGNSTGQLVNINTASASELRQSLHISSTTAQNIVNYRLQHGPYTSVDQLLQVVSRSIYNKIKDLVTVS